MPTSHIPSAEVKKGTKSSYKRRKDQNSEIEDLEALLPWAQKGAGIDKISVLRLTSTFIKFRDFWDSLSNDSNSSKKSLPGIEKLFSEAIDGFLIILASSGEVLYVSEGVADYVGVTQQEIIGLSVYELTHSDDHTSIRENLKAKGIKPKQFRQFFVRFKSSVSTVKKQLSKFGGTIMLQVSGSLKISQRRNQYIVTGLVAECRRIESSPSILEVSIPQVMFTSTTTMDLKILSVDTKMSSVTGFSGDIKGTILTDFFHPSDNKRSINCLKLLLITGQANSPIIRFMTHTGEWVWVQIQGLLRYEKDNKTPKYLEANFKLICASGDNLTMIEQKELYGKVSENGENSGIHADSRFAIPEKPSIQGPEAIVKGIEDTKVSPAVRDVLLHGREEALMSIPMNMDRLASWGEVVEAVVEYESSKGLTPNYNAPYPPPPPPQSIKPSLSASPLSSLSPTSLPSPLSFSTHDGSSIPLSHSIESSPQFSSPEPFSNPSISNPQSIQSNFSAGISASSDLYMPSHSSMTTIINDLVTSLGPSFTTGTDGTPMYTHQPAGHSNPNQYNRDNTFTNQIPQQYNQPSATQFNGAGTTPMQYNPIGTQFNGTTHPASYNGSNTVGVQQYNGFNTIANQYNGPGVIANQYNNGGGVANQYNNGGGVANQYNNGGAVANQYNNHNIIASQHNGANVIGTQYNGPNVMATQYNNTGTMDNQYYNPSTQSHQYDSTPTPSANQYNGVNIIANQYIGVQPHNNGPIYNAVPQHVNGFQQQMPPPTINMNVTINVPPPTSHHKITYDPVAPNYAHLGEVKSSIGQIPKSGLPYNLQGTFEVSHPNEGWSNDSPMDDDILEALQLFD